MCFWILFIIILVWVAITKCQRLGDLNSRHVFLTVLETEKSQINLPADLVPGEYPLPGLHTIAFHHDVLTWKKERIIKRKLFYTSSCKGTNPFGEDSTLIDLIYS